MGLVVTLKDLLGLIEDEKLFEPICSSYERPEFPEWTL